ncbi:hypothetical protein BJ912DRAFT_1062006 [Pholiota molesta]|nr:hypothetical protein BJ912DRAFT_1062006 [Pholiota molesta]
MSSSHPAPFPQTSQFSMPSPSERNGATSTSSAWNGAGFTWSNSMKPTSSATSATSAPSSRTPNSTQAPKPAMNIPPQSKPHNESFSPGSRRNSDARHLVSSHQEIVLNIHDDFRGRKGREEEKHQLTSEGAKAAKKMNGLQNVDERRPPAPRRRRGHGCRHLDTALRPLARHRHLERRPKAANVSKRQRTPFKVNEHPPLLQLLLRLRQLLSPL